jgi:hypothetical protein
VEKPIFIEKIIEKPNPIYIEEEEAEDPNLVSSNNKARNRVDALEREKQQLQGEIQTRRSRTPNRGPRSNNIVNYN